MQINEALFVSLVHVQVLKQICILVARVGVVKEEDYQSLVSRVFVMYLEVMQKLQLTYSLQPAGSHGVWGLDDYHFLPYILGSSELIDHKYMKPKSIHTDDILHKVRVCLQSILQC